jgi:hypothetical protein
MKPVGFGRLVAALLAGPMLLSPLAQAAPVPNLTDLQVYAKRGIATTDTHPTSNPITSPHLAKKATATGAFALRWSRKVPSIRPLKGTLVFFLWDAAKQQVIKTNEKLPWPAVVIPGKASETKIEYSIPSDTKPGLYRAIIVSDKANTDLGFTNFPPISTSVLITFKGASP